jgi:hypothetical protein
MTHLDETRAGGALRQCVGRMETSIEALESIADPNARGLARDLLESALDLHAIALTKVLTICQETENGDLLIRNLLADAYVGAVVLLHGLHPQDAEARLRSKLAEMRPHWGVCGFRVELTHVDRTAARVRVAVSDNTDRETYKALALEIEQVLTEAAPDLDGIVVEVSDKSVQTLALVPSNSSKVLANDCDSQTA